MSRALPPASLQLGLGLVSIGRVWGVANRPVPSEDDARTLLRAAFEGGVRIFDTAPAYGASERRLGDFLSRLPAAERGAVTVMTKVGEHWDEASGEAYVDHGYDAMMRSLERSIGLLGRVDLLQLHKATEEAIVSSAVQRLFGEARGLGIPVLGASVSSIAAGRLALGTRMFSALQFPLNAGDRKMEPLLADIEAAGGFPIVNRPFAMGAAVHGAADGGSAGAAAFAFLKALVPRGVVLTGTGNATHLMQNLRSFGA